MGYKIIDYDGNCVKDDFKDAETAYKFMWSTYTKDFINDMDFRIVKDEEENE